MHVFELEDVILMLSSEVKRAGGQVAWSKKTGINRATLNKILNGHQPPTKSIIRALKLRMVFVSYPKLPQSK
jgi:DNA-binding phage protein